MKGIVLTETRRRLFGGEGIQYYGMGLIEPFSEYERRTMTINNTEVKPLQPLTHGNILIVGTKASNFDDDLRTHPRIIMWDSLEESRWRTKEVPQNVRCVFFTRFIGHDSFKNIMKEARKKHITIFNQVGTGVIARQVKELLTPVSTRTPWMEPEVVKPEVVVTTKEESTMPEVTHVRVAWNVGESKLAPLTQFIDYSKNNITNARALYKKSEELNIQTTLASLSQFVRAQIRKNAGIVVERKKTRIHVERQERIKTVQQDESVEILDRLIQDMKDLRQFFVATTQENAKLKSKLDKFRKFFED